MKKFVISLVILIIVGGVAFYFGWVQLRLPADTYAVAFSKTGGWDDHVLVPGHFVWRWEALIPRNFKLYTYTLTPQHHDVNVSGSLPSGDVYSQFLPGNPDFSYTINITVSYKIKPDDLPSMTKTGAIAPDTMDAWYKSFDTTLVQQAQDILPALMNTQSSDTSAPSFASIATALQKDLAAKFPEIDFLGVAPTQLRFPDLKLYAHGRSMYETVLQTRTQAIEEATRAEATDQVKTNNRLEMLKQYGQVLSEYPILLKYLAIEAGQNPDSVNLDNLKLPQFPQTQKKQQ